MNTKTHSILGILVVVGIAGAYFATRPAASESSEAASGSGAPLFPDLVSKADAVSTIIVKRAATQITINKDGETWRVAEKAGYPAKPDAVRALLIGLSQLKLEEPKTQRPEQYSKLGVDDPVAPPPDSADKNVPQSSLITLKDSTGKEIAAVILGNPKYGGQGVVGSGSSGVYVRKPGDKQSWLAMGTVELQREPIGWLESTFADIKRERIKSVVVSHPIGGTVTVSRDKQADPFIVKDIPAGRELKDPGIGEGIAATLTGMTFQDVAAPSAMEASAGSDLKPGPTVTLRTFDGLVITATSITKDAKAWWRMAASADEAILATLPPTAAAASATTADGSKPDAPATPPSAPATLATPESPPVGTAIAIKKEVADLNARWSPYAFAPADWKVKSVNTPIADMLKEPSPAVSAPPAAPGVGAPGQP